ncbi:unnamed protein product [Aphanomyces euteiches]
MDRRVECANPQRNLRVHAAELVKKSKEGPEWQSYVAREPHCTFHFSPDMPLISPSTLDCGQQWPGHDDAVYSVQVIVDNTTVTLLTASYDRQVKIWRLNDGECIGVLAQGDMELSRKSYNFPIDFPARELDKLRNAKPVIKEARKMQRQEDARPIRRKKKEAAPPSVDTTEYLFEATPTTALPPLQKTSALWSSNRKTPRIRPIDRKHAGRLFRGLITKKT